MKKSRQLYKIDILYNSGEGKTDFMSFSIRDEMPELVQQYALYLRNIRGLSPKTVE